MKRVFTACIFILLCIACADEKKTSEIEESQPLSFTSRTIEKKLDDCLPENGDCTFISLNYPVAENGEGEADEINKRIEKFLLVTIDYQDDGAAKKPEELVENFINSYKETRNEFPEYDLPWEATVEGKIAYRSPEIISIKFNTYMFTGGAHGYRSTNYLNFDPDSGNRIEPGELFTLEFKEFVEKDFREKQNIPANSNINSTGMFFENDEFHLPANIGITEDEIILHYNAYEIAPYAEGNFVLSYPRDLIKRFMKIEKESQPES